MSKRYIVKQGKGFLGYIVWHVWDTTPKHGDTHSMMEASSKKACQDYAKELNGKESKHGKTRQ